VLLLGQVQNGLHNVHFTDNYSDLLGAVEIDILNGGMHDVHVLNNRSLLGSIFQVNDLTGGIHRARFVGNTSVNETLAVEGTFTGGLNDSVFIGNRAQLPGDFPAYAEFSQSAVASAAVLENNVILNNNVFLANHTNQTNAQNPAGTARGATVVHNTGNASGASAVAIAAQTGKRTLFYGNTHTTGSGAAPSGIHFESAFDYEIGDMPSYAGNPMTVNVAMDADNGGKILMLDPLSSQPDNLPGQTINNPATITYGGITYDLGDDPYEVKYSNLTVNLEKTGAGDWYLGGVSNMPGASTWDINGGTLTLTTVNYGGTGALGVVDAGINLSHASTAAFNLASGATLTGSGAITAKTITLQGDIRPGTWVNTGTLAANIANDISDADIAAIDVAKASDYGTLAFTGDVKMTGAKYYANVGSTGKNLLDVKGALTLDGSANELTLRLFSDTDVSNTAIISATGGITGSFDPLNVFVTAPAFLDTSSVTASATQVGKNIEVNTSNAVLAWNTAGANTLALDAATPVFSINQNLTGTGTLTTDGAGTTLFLNGVNDYTGDTTVAADTTLRVGETKDYSTASVASKVDVASGAVIGGYGTLLGDLKLNAGAVFSPGASIGKLETHGDISAGGAIYEFEIDPAGNADQWEHKGSNAAPIKDNTLRIIRASDAVGDWANNSTVTYKDIIKSDAGFDGPGFAAVDNKLLFLTEQVVYNDKSIDLIMTRGLAACTWCQSGNQGGVYRAIGALPATHAVAQATMNMTDPALARAAMDNLSGEVYGSTRNALLTNNRLRNMAQARMQGLGADFASAQPVMVASNGATSLPLAAPSQRLWVNTWAYNGDTDGNRNAAKTDHSGIGLALGGDVSVGALFGYEDGKVKNGGTRKSRTDVDSYSLGGYATANAGGIDLQGGLIYSHMKLDASRTITVGGLAGKAKSSYDGRLKPVTPRSRRMRTSRKPGCTPTPRAKKARQRRCGLARKTTASRKPHWACAPRTACPPPRRWR